MAEGIEHTLVGEHAASERKLVADFTETVGHAILVVRFDGPPPPQATKPKGRP